MTAAPLVLVAMMQKDEGVILARWLDHYGGLFGSESLVIYDNFSTDPLTLALLRKAETQGVRVHRYMPDYREKARLILRLFMEHDSRPGKADFYIPVDCDEYLVALTPEGISFEKDAIHAELWRHRAQTRCLQIPGSFYNDPGQDGAYVLDRPFVKSFFRSGALGSLDLGFHFGSSGLDPEREETGLIYLHHHNKALALARETARFKLAPAEAIDYHGAGANYLRWLINCTDAEYETRYSNRLRVTLQPGEPIWLLYPDGQRLRWSGAAYLAQNPDVRDHYPLGALHHYLACGREEGRLPGVADA